jgi:hypothetical protein
MMNQRYVALLVCVCLSVLVLAAGEPATAGCLKCRVKGYVAALNAHDVEKALSYLSDELALVSRGTETSLDKTALREMLGWDVAVQSAVSYESLDWEGETVTALFTERNDFYELLGISERRYRVTFGFEGDNIASLRVEPVADDAPSLAEALRPVVEWASTGHGELLAEIYADGDLVLSEGSARKWMELLRAWRAGA